jgi:hypothetical protein
MKVTKMARNGVGLWSGEEAVGHWDRVSMLLFLAEKPGILFGLLSIFELAVIMFAQMSFSIKNLFKRIRNLKSPGSNINAN